MKPANQVVEIKPLIVLADHLPTMQHVMGEYNPSELVVTL